MSLDLIMSAQVQLNATDVNVPSMCAYPFNFQANNQNEPFITSVDVLPSDVFGGGKAVNIRDLGTQNFILVVTDLPVQIRVRDANADSIDRTLRQGGSFMTAGGDPDVDQIDFAGIATSTPKAKVTIIAIGG